jgi:hypothetical protein
MTTREERIRTVRLKIKRAKKHVDDLKAEIDVFFKTNPYVIGGKTDPNTRRPIYYMSKVDPVPDEIPQILGDAITNLRASLDHVAWGLVEANGKTPTRDTGFPICKDFASYSAPEPVTKKTKGMSAKAKGCIDATQPYQGGNDLFWILNELSNTDKHRFILVAGSAFHSMDLGHFAPKEIMGIPLPKISAFYAPADKMFPLKAGDELFVGLPDTEVDQNLPFRFEVALGEPGIVRGSAIVETVDKMANLVDSIFGQFEPLL